jgi:hypothetical protein
MLLPALLQHDIPTIQLSGSIFQQIEERETQYTISVDLKAELRKLFTKIDVKIEVNGVKVEENGPKMGIQSELCKLICDDFGTHGSRGIVGCVKCSNVCKDYEFYEADVADRTYAIYLGTLKNTELIKMKIQKLAGTWENTNEEDLNESLILSEEDIKRISSILKTDSLGCHWQICKLVESVREGSKFVEDINLKKNLCDEFNKLDVSQRDSANVSVPMTALKDVNIQDITTQTFVKIDATWEFFTIDMKDITGVQIINENLSKQLESKKIFTKQDFEIFEIGSFTTKNFIKSGTKYYTRKDGVSNNIYFKAIESTSYRKSIESMLSFYNLIQQANTNNGNYKAKDLQFLVFMIFLLQTPNIASLIMQARFELDMKQILDEVDSDLNIMDEFSQVLKSAREEMKIIFEINLLIINTLCDKVFVGIDLTYFDTMRQKKNTSMLQNLLYYSVLLYYNSFVSQDTVNDDILPNMKNLRQCLSKHSLKLDFNNLSQKMADITTKVNNMKEIIGRNNSDSESSLTKFKMERVDMLTNKLMISKTTFLKVLICIAVCSFSSTY